MWRTTSGKHTPKHHSCLPCQPHVIVAPVCCPQGSHIQPPATPCQDDRRQTGQAPFRQGAGRCHGPCATRQGLPFDPPLVGPHPPFAGLLGGRNEVHVSPVRGERGMQPQGP